MNPEQYDKLRKLRNQLMHGAHEPNFSDLAKQLKELGVSGSPSELLSIIPTLLDVFGGLTWTYVVPKIVAQAVGALIDGYAAQVVCDPCAGLGALAATIQEKTKARKVLTFTQTDREAALGKSIAKDFDWKVGDSLHLLSQINEEIDVVASVLPFGMRQRNPVTLKTKAGKYVELQDDFGNIVLAAATLKLSESGIGLFVIPPSFFFSKRSVLRQFDALGIGMEGALALPSGTFAPYSNIQTYLAIVRNRPTSQMFVAELSSDQNTNLQIISNFREGRDCSSLELGRFVDPLSFTGVEAIRAEEMYIHMEEHFGADALRLDELAREINMGRFGSDFEFPKQENDIFIPLIGNSDVVDSVQDLTLKKQNYSQVVIDPARSYARFVAQFLNSELGKEILEMNKSGAVIQKLNKRTLKGLRIFIPGLPTQKKLLDIEARIAGGLNTLLGLKNELNELRRVLWFSPHSAQNVNERVSALTNQISGSLKQQVDDRLDQWFETLPFPLASILRAWQATESQDYKTKYEHLLHFFEGTVEFIGLILLSAFSSNEALFYPHKKKIKELLEKQRLSFQRATFGTWKLVVEYLGKQTRQLLSGEGKKPEDQKYDRNICVEIFADPALDLLNSLCRKELVAIFAATNKMRNDWGGHSGVVGQEEARFRNEQLLAELQKLREVIADAWMGTQLIRALHTRPRRGVFENEVAILMGSNSEFLKETRSMATWLDVERIYLSRKDSGRALKLLPLLQVGASPQSAKNACYFFNRLERDGVRFVSYHFTDHPELTGKYEETTEAIRLLEET